MPFLLWWFWLPIVCAAMNEIMLHDLTCSVRPVQPTWTRDTNAPSVGLERGQLPPTSKTLAAR